MAGIIVRQTCGIDKKSVRKLTLTILLLLFGGSGIALGQTTGGSPASGPSSGLASPPAYSTVRWDENYSYLRDPFNRSDFFDPIKFIPLNSAGDWYLSLGGQIRDRFEVFNHTNFGGGPQDRDGYNLLRLLAHADVHLGENFRVFIQGKSAIESGREGGPRPIDMDTIDLQQGFGELLLPIGDRASVSIRAGRQELAFGKERLIGVVDWTNVERTNDGVRATFQSPNNVLDLFWVRPVVVEKYEFNDNQGQTSFCGIYDTLTVPGSTKARGAHLSLYGLWLNLDGIASYSASSVAGKGDSNTYTLGTELTATAAGFDFDLEADYQFGDFKGQQISAYSVATEEGYTFAQAAFAPRPFIGFDIASGDHDSRNKHIGTFNQLFPTAHPFFGYMDFLGRQNVIDVHPGIELTLLKERRYARSISVRTEYHQFWRESTSDATYNTAGGVFRPAGAGDSSSIGGELDTLLRWQVDRHLGTYFGYSRFFAGKYLEQTGPSRDVDWFYAAATYTF